MSVAKLKDKKEERKQTMGVMNIDHEAIKSLANLINDTGLTEIEIADGDKRIRVMKSAAVAVQAPVVAAAPAAAAPVTAVVTAAPAGKPEDHPFMKGLGASALEGNKIAGLSVFWNTPVTGLRAGYGLEFLPQGDLVVGPGLVSELEYQAHVFSVEYTKDKWTVAAEYKINNASLDFTLPFIPDSESTDNIVYGQVTYQATDKVGLGVYHSHADFENGDTVDDTAVAVSYAIQPWWLVKAEAHAIDGLHSLGDSGDVNPGATDQTWSYFVLKTTLSF